MENPQEKEQDTASLMAGIATEHVKAVYHTMNVLLDFTAGSLTKVDELITRYFPDGVTREQTPTFWGAYTGETVRRNLGGQWVTDQEYGPHLINVLGTLSAFPLAWAGKRFQQGEQESLASKYRVTIGLARVRGGVSTLPEPDLPTPAELQAMIKADADYGAEADVLPSCILGVFFLLAAAKGGLNSGSRALLDQHLGNTGRYHSRLFRNSLTAVPSVMEAVITAVEENMRIAFTYLEKTRKCLEEVFPAEAGAFKADLMAFAQAVAGRSRGFLGFGGGPSKTAKNSLLAIAHFLYGEE